MAVETLPVQSYLAANERVRLLLLSAQAHDRAGHTMKALEDINLAADIEIESARAKRILKSADDLDCFDRIQAQRAS